MSSDIQDLMREFLQDVSAAYRAATPLAERNDGHRPRDTYLPSPTIDLERLNALLDGGADINTQISGVYGYGGAQNLLSLACKAGDADAIRLLVSRGARRPDGSGPGVGSLMTDLVSLRVIRAQRLTPAQHAECMRLILRLCTETDLAVAVNTVMCNTQFGEEHIDILLDAGVDFTLTGYAAGNTSEAKLRHLVFADSLRPIPSITRQKLSDGYFGDAQRAIIDQVLEEGRRWSVLRAAWIGRVVV